jgi:hypothetical protein
MHGVRAIMSRVYHYAEGPRPMGRRPAESGEQGTDREVRDSSGSASARQFRRQAVKIVTPPPIRHSVLPFGEGSTKIVPEGTCMKKRGRERVTAGGTARPPAVRPSIGRKPRRKRPASDRAAPARLAR